MSNSLKIIAVKVTNFNPHVKKKIAFERQKIQDASPYFEK